MNYNPIWVCLKMVDTQNGCFNEENNCNPLELGVNIDKKNNKLENYRKTAILANKIFRKIWDKNSIWYCHVPYLECLMIGQIDILQLSSANLNDSYINKIGWSCFVPLGKSTIGWESTRTIFFGGAVSSKCLEKNKGRWWFEGGLSRRIRRYLVGDFKHGWMIFHNWLVVWNMAGLFSLIYGIILPTD